jgi:hypothetical protein
MRSSLSQRSGADTGAARSEDFVEALPTPQAPEPDVVNKELAHGEQIKRIPRCGVWFGTTMKVKRAVLLKRYAADIDGLPAEAKGLHARSGTLVARVA